MMKQLKSRSNTYILIGLGKIDNNQSVNYTIIRKRHKSQLRVMAIFLWDNFSIKKKKIHKKF